MLIPVKGHSLPYNALAQRYSHGPDELWHKLLKGLYRGLYRGLLQGLLGDTRSLEYGSDPWHSTVMVLDDVRQPSAPGMARFWVWGLGLGQ